MKKNLIKVLLLVEDNPADVRLLREMFHEQDPHNTELTQVETIGEAEQYLATTVAPDIILLDLGLADAQGMEAIRRARAAAPHVPLVVFTALDDELMGTLALQEGVQDYLIKGQIDARGLLRALHYAVERKSLEVALSAERELAQVTLNSIGDAVIRTDASGKITFLNPVAERMTGWSREEAAGRSLAEVFQIVDATTRKTSPNVMEMVVRQDRIIHLPSNCALIPRNGFEIPIEDSAAPIHDREGRAAGVVIVFHDVGSTKKMALQMAHSAHHDFLTGLPNRKFLNDRIRQAISSASRNAKKSQCCFWIWMASNTSTIPWDIRSATDCFNLLPNV